MNTSNTKHLPSRALYRGAGRDINRMSTALLAAFCGALLVTGASAYGQVIAQFSGGGSHASPNTTVADAYTGIAEDGWTSAWELRNNYGTGSMGSVNVVSGGDLWSGGNRLQFTPSNNGTGTGFGVNRTYDASHGDLDANQPMIIKFQISIDDLGAFLSSSTNQLFIGENNTDSINRTSGTSWYLSAYGGTNPNAAPGTSSSITTARQMQWNVGNGGNVMVPTGILLQEGVIYTFTLTINPAQYSYTLLLDNGTDVFQSENLAFRSEEVMGRMLVVGQQYATGEGATFSFGALEIKPIPEPTSVAFLTVIAMLGGVALKTAGRRRR